MVSNLRDKCDKNFMGSPVQIEQMNCPKLAQTGISDRNSFTFISQIASNLNIKITKNLCSPPNPNNRFFFLYIDQIIDSKTALLATRKVEPYQ